MSARSFNWRSTALNRIAEHIHEMAAEAGRAVNVYVRGDAVLVCEQFSNQHADDYIGCFDTRAPVQVIVNQLVAAANAEVS